MGLQTIFQGDALSTMVAINSVTINFTTEAMKGSSSSISTLVLVVEQGLHVLLDATHVKQPTTDVPHSSQSNVARLRVSVVPQLNEQLNERLKEQSIFFGGSEKKNNLL
jgi:hypothetical protein